MGDSPTTTTPEMPATPDGMTADDASRWYILVERYKRMDTDIRGQEALGGTPPPWLNRRRSERAALAWAMGLVAKHHACPGGAG